MLMAYALINIDWVVEAKRTKELMKASNCSCITILLIANDCYGTGNAIPTFSQDNKKTTNFEERLCIDDDRKSDLLKLDKLISME